MLKLVQLCLLATLAIWAIGCGQAGPSNSNQSNSAAAAPAGPGAATPTEAYKQLYSAVKSKDTEAIKAAMTKRTLEFAKSVAARQNSPLEKVLENGFTGTTFSDTLPEIRDERVKDNMGSVEVRNTKDNRWEDLPFINEGGGWKLAIGELFGGTFKSPGKGRDALEKEAANTMGGGMIEGKPPAAGNMNGVVNTPPFNPGTANNSNR